MFQFNCPHCKNLINVDCIPAHVRDIFGGYLHECTECSFRTNDEIVSYKHKMETNHKFENFNAINPLLNKAIEATTTIFFEAAYTEMVNYNSLDKSETNDPVDETINHTQNSEVILTYDEVSDMFESSNVAISDLFGNINCLENIPDVDQTDVIQDAKNVLDIDKNKTRTSNKDITEEQNEKKFDNFFDDTIDEIIEMSSDYKKLMKLYRGPGEKNITVGYGLFKKNFTVTLPVEKTNEKEECRKCKKAVKMDYISRRNHVFEFHSDDIKKNVKNVKKLKKFSILCEGFLLIKEYFSPHRVFTDFQCLKCGKFIKSQNGMTCHAGTHNSNHIKISCPKPSCNYKGSGASRVRSHCHKHSKDTSDKSEGNIYLKNPNFIRECKISEKFVLTIVNFYFPIYGKELYDKESDSKNDSKNDSKKDSKNDSKNELVQFCEKYISPWLLSLENGFMETSQAELASDSDNDESDNDDSDNSLEESQSENKINDSKTQVNPISSLISRCSNLSSSTQQNSNQEMVGEKDNYHSVNFKISPNGSRKRDSTISILPKMFRIDDAFSMQYNASNIINSVLEEDDELFRKKKKSNEDK
uniref:C2H2-type domain-containing protein n=1 Tax=Parastrongyloides trichosuri TaxID=131310 RepID=A0A0N4ZZ65_PARTI